jgi:hypothetical protein
MNIRTISRAMTILVTLALLFSVSTASGQAAPAYSATIDHTFTDGYTIVAEWNSIDGDIFTYVSVMAVENMSPTAPQPGGPQMAPSLIVSGLQYNNVTGELYYRLGGETTTFSFSVADNLSSALLQGTVTYLSPLGPVDVPVNLALTAASELVADNYVEHFAEPGAFVYTFHSKGESRDAVATGTVAINGVNLTPRPSTTAIILYAKTGSVTVQIP